MKKLHFILPLAVLIISLCSCNKETVQEFVKCKIDGVEFKFTDIADWQYQDSTGANYFLAWCYTNSGDIDHNFMAINFPRMEPGNYILNTGPNGSPSGSGYCVSFNNAASDWCVLHAGSINVDIFEQEQSFIDPFKRFHGYFNFTLVNTVTTDTLQVTDGEFNFSDF